MVENNESEGPLIVGKYCAYTEKNCLIKEKYNKLRDGVLGLRRRVDLTLDINDWNQYKDYLLERLDKLFEDSTFGTREFWWGLSDDTKEVVYKDIYKRLCEDCAGYAEDIRKEFVKNLIKFKLVNHGRADVDIWNLFESELIAAYSEDEE